MDTLPNDIVEYIHVLKYKSYFDDVVAELKQCVSHSLTECDSPGHTTQSQLYLKHLDTYIWYQFSNNFLQVFFTNTMYYLAPNSETHYCYQNLFI